MKEHSKVTEEEKKKLEERELQAEKQKELKNKKNIENFLSGKPYTHLSINRILLRIVDDVIETSKGAKVKVCDALELWNKIRNKQDIKGFKLGAYTVIDFDGTILTVGCHKIEITEVLRIVKLLEVRK